ncbi:hypothetical protein POX_g09239 [Penicillium oxalicum]|uniref:Uncharacterized protein n=1 Tax=Penicillium oxalicum (strain 114-2 / CGMCC 5302) TaxID=933388 RepID=S7Z7D1_PENO1|nr:hypothetical protein POX_g09239 [Penicillium oxalicum]EPS26465.1 hypothetical protein PDE_01402 [Penicillium oxalicum 114-2]KAI2786843.1 hypothetical protein POX_g09239 [Penicillium oxalicum]
MVFSSLTQGSMGPPDPRHKSRCQDAVLSHSFSALEPSATDRQAARPGLATAQAHSPGSLTSLPTGHPLMIIQPAQGWRAVKSAQAGSSDATAQENTRGRSRVSGGSAEGVEGS